jgi:hypothetical protein
VNDEVRASLLLLALCAALPFCRAQGLSPRAYVIAPRHSNALTLTYTINSGDVVFSPDIPIQNASGRINYLLLTYFHTVDFFGRSSNIAITLPYALGHFNGQVNGVEQKLYRSGLAPMIVRFSVNMYGGPSMDPREYSQWRQRLLIGTSLTVSTQTGQYDPANLINIGTNRWAFKPEVGLSRRWGNWVLDAYGAAWLFTPNDNFFSRAPGTHPPNRQTQEPMGSTELHLSYNFKPRLWASLDGNYWYGGQTSLNGKVRPTTLQANSRAGFTVAIPTTDYQAIKFSWSRGTFITFGGNFNEFSLGYQYSWIRHPR